MSARKATKSEILNYIRARLDAVPGFDYFVPAPSRGGRLRSLSALDQMYGYYEPE